MRLGFVSESKEPELHFLVNHYAEQCMTPPPRLMLLEDDDALIYSTGSPVCLVISEGCLSQLSCEEFERRLVSALRALAGGRGSLGVH
jgi:hypothetical protein